MDILEKERIVQKNIIDLFKENYNNSLSDDEILNTIPQELDKKDTPFYESILDIFLLEPECESIIKGKVKDTVKKVAKLWSKTPHSFYYA